MKTRLLYSLLILLTTFLLVQQSSAIPAFARKYDMSCNVCHSPVPKLKPYGEDFAANGYQLQDKEPVRFTRQTGDDQLLLMRELPLALRIDGYSRYLSKNSPESDIEWPFILKILSGGQITKDVSYFLYFLFNERGSVAGVEDAFLYFNDIASTGLSATVGQYQVADPIFKRELRPTFEDYAIYTVKPGLTKCDLAYDRGIMLGYTLPTETDLIVSLVNGNGIGSADAQRNFDSDSYKNVFFRVAQPVTPEFSIGGLGYIGKERDLGTTNTVSMLGADAKVYTGTIELGVQYVHRSDKNPFFLWSGVRKIATDGAFAELMYAPESDKSRWYLFFLYNNVRSDLAELKYHSATGNVTYMLARNLKLSGEYTYDLEKERHRVTLGFLAGF